MAFLAFKDQDPNWTPYSFSKAVSGVNNVIGKIKAQLDGTTTANDLSNQPGLGSPGNANKVKSKSNSSVNSAKKTNTIDNKIKSIVKNSSNATRDNNLEELQKIADRNNKISIEMNRENNEFNADQAQLQRDYEALMSSTAHQREVADLQAAGLNPVLSAGGMGASTPTGSNASASNFTGVDTSLINALAQITSNAISANSALITAETSAQAQRDVALTQKEASMYAADRGVDSASITAGGMVGAANVTAQGNRDVASMYNATNRELGYIKAFIPWA